MLKRIATTLAFAFVLTLTLSAQRIATVNVSEILENLSDYKNAQTQLDRVAAEWRQEIAQDYDEIKGLYNRYQAEQVLLSDEQRKQREEEIMEKEKAVREKQKQKFGPEGELFEKRQELVQPIQERVYTAIETYANDKGFDFIFDRGSSSGMIFTNEEYDKTKDIMKQLGINK